jgi:stage II sporulation protein D
MRRSDFLTLAGGLAGSALCFCGTPPLAQTVGSSTVRVRLFAASEIVRVSVGNVTVDSAAQTISQGSSTSPLGSGVLEFSSDGPLRVTATTGGSTVTRSYLGTIFIARRRTQLLIVNRVGLEDYVASVLSAEVSPGWPPESLRAQAIAVRTYAARAAMTARAREYDLRDDTSSQVYPGADSPALAFAAAAQATAAKILTFAGLPASIFYSSACGGHTASSEEISGAAPPPYLTGVSDNDVRGHAYCQISPYFRWTNSVETTAMERVIGVSAGALHDISVQDRWPDGRVRSLTASCAAGPVTLSGREFYERALGVLGYKVIPSTFFDITRQGANFILVGHGVGHGVGMCQWGARGRAQAGMSAEQILQAYFPGTAIV